MANIEAAFGVQRRVRGPWRRYLDCLAPFRSELHRYCCQLTSNVWDGEDLVQDTLLRVFGMLGKIDVQLDNPKVYLIRTATNLWIDRMRRSLREQELLQLAAQQEPASTMQLLSWMQVPPRASCWNACRPRSARPSC